MLPTDFLSLSILSLPTSVSLNLSTEPVPSPQPLPASYLSSHTPCFFNHSTPTPFCNGSRTVSVIDADPAALSVFQEQPGASLFMTQDMQEYMLSGMCLGFSPQNLALSIYRGSSASEHISQGRGALHYDALGTACPHKHPSLS